jgi:LysM repeat protein
MYYYRQCLPGTTQYAVKPGDTLLSLAQQFNTSVLSIVAANPLIDPDYLRVGQQICMPQQITSSKCPGGNTYTVGPGERIAQIAQFFNVTLNALIQANPGVDMSNLSAGQIICLPIPAPPIRCPEGSIPYIIRPGDTFHSIAQRVTTTVEAIMQANPDLNPNALLVGQQICIPIPSPNFP